MRILVVDGDGGASPAVYLRREGFDVMHVGSEAAARKAVAESPPHVVVMDVLLPDGDGMRLCRSFCTVRSFAVIVLTLKSSVEERIEGLEVGVDDYIPKPCSVRELVLRIRSVLKRFGRG
ncbi:response regulator transcription factor [Streptomyces sp. NBC_01497]|uniref:response regulator transcription factor n=1 Tax=Streptomyces sp. NBC_01497 TaxID=2903885 RepID=UPI002E32EC66|nr:response regulator transcription factor [Streptomyces sp. NBC_01497]